MTQGVPGLVRRQPRLGDFAGDLYQLARRPAGVLTRGPVVVAVELVCPRGFLDLLGQCHGLWVPETRLTPADLLLRR